MGGAREARHACQRATYHTHTRNEAQKLLIYHHKTADDDQEESVETHGQRSVRSVLAAFAREEFGAAQIAPTEESVAGQRPLTMEELRLGLS
jgi:hypothetical protein